MIRRSPGSTLIAVLVASVGVLEAAAIWSLVARKGELALDLGAGGGAFAVIVALVAAARRPPQIEVWIDAGDLRVAFRGWDMVWTLRREVRIPVAQIRTVTVYRPESLWPGWWHRRLGTVVPGIIKAGWFGGVAGRELWDVRAAADVVDVRLAEASPLCRIVLEVPDPATLAALLEEAVRTV